MRQSRTGAGVAIRIDAYDSHHRLSSHRLERLHDVRLVCSSAQPVVASVVRGGIRQLGHRALGVPAAGPANRIAYHQLSLAQLKIVREVITLSVFVPFAVF